MIKYFIKLRFNFTLLIKNKPFKSYNSIVIHGKNFKS